MATIKDIKISRKWSTRPTGNGNYPEMVWRIEKGKEYDLVSFSINELNKPYCWYERLCLPCGMSEEKIKQIVERYAKDQINEQAIEDYARFLKNGERWGWD